MVEAQLTLATADLEAAELLAKAGNRTAIFHLEQAVEKIAKAVRAHRGLPVTDDHHISWLVEGGGKVKDGLAKDDPWRERLLRWRALSDFATTARYPTTSGKVKPVPEAATTLADAENVGKLLALAKKELV